MNDSGYSSKFKQKRTSEHVNATVIYQQARAEMMQDMNMMLSTVSHSPNRSMAPNSSFLVSPTISPRDQTARRKQTMLLAAKARRNTHQQTHFKTFCSTIGSDGNQVARKIDHNLTIKLRSDKRVPSIGAAGGFR